MKPFDPRRRAVFFSSLVVLWVGLLAGAPAAGAAPGHPSWQMDTGG